jgi:hypothetical protein
MINDLTGKKFNMLRVIRQVIVEDKKNSYWLCQCDCGDMKVYARKHLVRKEKPIRSCGCVRYRGNKYREY